MPELASVAIALAALLITFAWTLIFSRALSAIRPYVPGLFLPLFDALAGADAAAYNALRGWADQTLSPLTALIQVAISSIDGLTQNPLAFARATYASLARIYQSEIPFLIRWAETVAAGYFAQAEALAQTFERVAEQEFAALTAEAAGLAAGLQNLAQRVEGQIVPFLQALEAYTLGLFGKAEADAAALVGQEAARAVSAEQAAVAQAEAEAAALQAAIDSEIIRFESELGTLAAGLESEVLKARADLEAVDAGLQAAIPAAVEAAVMAYPNALLHRISPDAKATLAKDIEAIVTVGLARIRAEIKDIDSLRAKYAPAVQAEIDKLKAAV